MINQNILVHWTNTEPTVAQIPNFIWHMCEVVSFSLSHRHTVTPLLKKLCLVAILFEKSLQTRNCAEGVTFKLHNTKWFKYTPYIMIS